MILEGRVGKQHIIISYFIIFFKNKFIKTGRLITCRDCHTSLEGGDGQGMDLKRNRVGVLVLVVVVVGVEGVVWVGHRDQSVHQVELLRM